MNTYSSIIASVVATFGVSALSNKEGKLHIDHIQNAVLAGGVSIGMAINYNFQRKSGIDSANVLSQERWLMCCWSPTWPLCWGWWGEWPLPWASSSSRTG